MFFVPGILSDNIYCLFLLTWELCALFDKFPLVFCRYGGRSIILENVWSGLRHHWHTPSRGLAVVLEDGEEWDRLSIERHAQNTVYTVDFVGQMSEDQVGSKVCENLEAFG